MFKQEGYDLMGAAFEVFNEIAVELQALKELCSEHEAQLFNTMRIARKRVGYLINFGKKGELEWKRFVLDDLHLPLEQ